MSEIDDTKIFDYAHNVARNHKRIVEELRAELQDKDYIIYTRAGSPIEFPKVQFTIGSLKDDLPDFVMTGELAREGVEAFIKLCRDHLIRRVPEHVTRLLMHVDEMVKIINEELAANGNEFDVRAIAIDTSQFMWGVGMNARRFYGDYAEDVKVIQLQVARGGVFPEDIHYPQALYPQPLLPTSGFGNYRTPIPQWVKMQRQYQIHRFN
ncbi:hypothetical protein AVT69_gp327 [Pseudomonas phage PhiPA3]|uniref:Uncharacterized protein 329 n=1 Tax=Pseudomonas phage PhiPA3 TaxID=998086 RepID=F8SJG5_BPPA3|nr:hypothetical protein AVT69_gp327 [Pseudomonas phage PhiPA3]AEH03752.1 hypothetical protein [Pseudomonas phage PhiPA3]